MIISRRIKNVGEPDVKVIIYILQYCVDATGDDHRSGRPVGSVPDRQGRGARARRHGDVQEHQAGAEGGPAGASGPHRPICRGDGHRQSVARRRIPAVRADQRRRMRDASPAGLGGERRRNLQRGLGLQERGARLFCISTDYVFNGEKGEKYYEFDTPDRSACTVRPSWKGSA